MLAPNIPVEGVPPLKIPAEMKPWKRVKEADTKSGSGKAKQTMIPILASVSLGKERYVSINNILFSRMI